MTSSVTVTFPPSTSMTSSAFAVAEVVPISALGPAPRQGITPKRAGTPWVLSAPVPAPRLAASDARSR